MSYSRPPLVVLDANVIIRDPWFEGESFRYLRDHLFLGHLPVIPRVALLESRAYLERYATQLLKDYAASGQLSPRNLARFKWIFKDSATPGEASVERLLDLFDDHLAQFLKVHNGFVADIPEVAIEEVVERSIARTKPFNKSDKGFRDSLIWYTLLELLQDYTKISLISGNIHDFSDGDQDLHPDLRAESQELLPDGWQVLYHRSVDSFVVDLDPEQATSAHALRRALRVNEYRPLDIWSWAEANLRRLLGDLELDAVAWAGLPYETENPRLVDLEQVIALDVPIVEPLEPGVMRIYSDLTFQGVFSISVGFRHPSDLVHPRQLAFQLEDPDSSWATVSLRAAGTIALRLDYELQSSTVLQAHAAPLIQWQGSYKQNVDSYLAEALAELDQ